MAYIFNIQGELGKIKPKSNKFNIDELRKITNGWFTPDKVGPVWILMNEEFNSNPDHTQYNFTASNFFMRDLYGPIMIVSSIELPNEWDIMDEYDKKFTIEEVELGFLNIYNKFLNGSHFDGSHFDKTKVNTKSNFFFRPYRLTEAALKKPEEYKKFLEASYPYIIESYKKDGCIIMLEDNESIIKVETLEEQIETLNKVIGVFLENEEYEKCTNLRNIKTELEKNNLAI